MDLCAPAHFEEAEHKSKHQLPTLKGFLIALRAESPAFMLWPCAQKSKASGGGYAKFCLSSANWKRFSRSRWEMIQIYPIGFITS
jgi:hypothetical protein